MSERFRIWLARLLIRMARRVCVYGFTMDHLDEALKYERKEMWPT